MRTIAESYGVSLEAVIAANADISDPNMISVGQVVQVPPPEPGAPAPDFKLIPDSELVNGPYNAQVDLAAYIREKGGYLSSYTEEVEGEIMTGAQIVEFAARNDSVNPRLLIALLEYHSGWLTQPADNIRNPEYPMGLPEPNRAGLYKQMTWTANNLNRGFYLWRVNGLGYYITTDGVLIPASPTINAGTAGLHYMLALILTEANWRQAVSPDGFIQTYQTLYGYPFDWAVEPLVPPGLTQPILQLPFEPGVRWVFTGGPHGGWGGGSAWSSLDFAPPKEQLGCIQNDEWVTAAASGVVTRSDGGIIILDLDMDGNEGTGWTIFYGHIETRDRVPVGTVLQAGSRIGHPSCEGGISTGTHVHIARRYNGEWIPINEAAKNAVPFTMDGWTAVDTGSLYNGYLTNSERIIEPCQCKDEENKIERP
ncbi:MAG TPA: LysM peptidoglycan-binding domain-containing protein [Anaerolineales bacterium]|nr:LysM peptidoglycan-binding domain-containing protein [Anaerolineales bacterium]